MSGSHVLPFYLQSEGMVIQKAIFEDVTLKAFFGSLDFNNKFS